MVDSEYTIDIYKSVNNKYWNSNEKSKNVKVCS